MPGPITHLKAAYHFQISENRRFQEPMLYLGSIAPDSVNTNGHAPKAVRWPAHLRDRDLGKWHDNARAFYREQRDVCDRSYLTGYILHIVTDIVWDLKFDQPLFAKLYESGVPEESLKETRWLEIYGYEREQTNLPWCKEVLAALQSAEPAPIGTLNPSEIERFKRGILELDVSEGRTPQFVNEEMMRSLICEVIQTAKPIFEIGD